MAVRAKKGLPPTMSKPTLPGALRPIATLPGHTDRAWHLSWSPSRPLLASCSSDREVRLHSFTPALVDGAPVYSFQHQSTIPTSHSRTVRSLAFNPTGTTLATASFDSTVGIWQQVAEAGIDDGAAPAGEGEWEALDPLEGHESECKSVEWSFDGRLLASCSRDKSVWIWEGVWARLEAELYSHRPAIGPAEFECLAVLMEHSQDVKAVTWHPCEEVSTPDHEHEHRLTSRSSSHPLRTTRPSSSSRPTPTTTSGRVHTPSRRIRQPSGPSPSRRAGTILRQRGTIW